MLILGVLYDRHFLFLMSLLLLKHISIISIVMNCFHFLDSFYFVGTVKRKGGGVCVCVYVRECLDPVLLNETCTLEFSETVFLRINYSGLSYLFCACYIIHQRLNILILS